MQPYDFDLFVARHNDAYTVQVRAGSVGELPAHPLTLPFDLARLPDKRRDVAEWIKQARITRLSGPAEVREARAFGKVLFDLLFPPGELLAGLRSSRSRLAPGERLRLRLRLPPTLVMLPWELLYDEYHGEFLALAPDLTLVRYPEMPITRYLHTGPLQIAGPLYVVAVLASPQCDDYPRLRIDRELGRLEHALQTLKAQGKVQLDVIRGPGTLDKLRERLRRPAHILHILSHGDLNRETGEGELIFEDTDGAVEPINAELLRMELERHSGQVQLITLNACLGALPAGDDPFSSVGLALIRSGVPAVVAMQFEIAEDVAADLTRGLYAELVAGIPVDLAVRAVRQQIQARYRTRLDWAIPVLFSRDEIGVLFAFPAGDTHGGNTAVREEGPAPVREFGPDETPGSNPPTDATPRPPQPGNDTKGSIWESIFARLRTLPFPQRPPVQFLLGGLLLALLTGIIIVKSVGIDTSFWRYFFFTVETPQIQPTVIGTVPPGLVNGTDKIVWMYDSGNTGTFDLYTANIDGSNRQQLTDDQHNDIHPAWSPDGTKVAFASNHDGDFELYCINADGSGRIQLTNNGSDDFMPTWSPDGTQIAFASNHDGDFELYRINADGSGRTQLTSNGVDDHSPAWSPTGLWIAFATNRDNNLEIYRLNLDTMKAERLTNNGFTDLAPAWSPNGERLAFVSNPSEQNPEIFVMPAAGTAPPEQLTQHGANDVMPAWLPPDNALVFVSDRAAQQSNVYRIDVEGEGTGRQPEDINIRVSVAPWSPQHLEHLCCFLDVVRQPAQ